jgi:phosphoglycerol geranylgeranyltransferase
MILNGEILNSIKQKAKERKPQIAVLIDPDKTCKNDLKDFLNRVNNSSIDYIFVGGSLIFNNIDSYISSIKTHTKKPVIIFPGSAMHISNYADGILLLSMISGRNPDFLIGNHVIAAPHLYNSKLEILSTSYLLIDGGKTSSVEYISNTKPIPADKNDIAIATAIAGEMLGHNLIYLEAGSGAINSVPNSMITEVKKKISTPIIVGGGIRTKSEIQDKFNAGADVVVIGNVLEENSDWSFILNQLGDN